MLEFFDTHAHLNMDPFVADPEPYIARAADAGVRCILIPGIDLASSKAAIRLAETYPDLYAAAGLHPQDCASAGEHYLQELEMLLQHPKVMAVGEIGLDYYRDYAPRELQKKVFCEQIRLARKWQMPMIIHNREADEDSFACLRREGYFRAQFHCYGSDAAFAEKVLAEGALISFTGVVTFSKKARSVLRNIPLERVMIETDCPWMAPVPHRGKTNEPAYVPEVASAYAEVYQESLENIAALTTATAKNFFNIPRP
jgi:TatD DNase family protein